MKTWLADTGPLIALLVGGDAFHGWACEQAKFTPPEIFTCEAVLTEVLFLLERDGHNPDELFNLIDSSYLLCAFDFRREYRAVQNLMRRYREQPMSFADACLVRLAEIDGNACIWTLDRHFQIYRQNRRETLSLVAPW